MTQPKVILKFFGINNACTHVFLCPFLFSSQGYQVAWDFSSVPGKFFFNGFFLLCTLPNNKRKFLQLAQMGGSSKTKSEPPTRSCLIQAGASLSSDLAPLACVCDQHPQITKECFSSWLNWVFLYMVFGYFPKQCLH